MACSCNRRTSPKPCVPSWKNASRASRVAEAERVACIRRLKIRASRRKRRSLHDRTFGGNTFGGSALPMLRSTASRLHRAVMVHPQILSHHVGRNPRSGFRRMCFVSIEVSCCRVRRKHLRWFRPTNAARHGFSTAPRDCRPPADTSAPRRAEPAERIPPHVLRQRRRFLLARSAEVPSTRPCGSDPSSDIFARKA
jgi:hypothetical protein